jgi:hypothetical protein
MESDAERESRIDAIKAADSLYRPILEIQGDRVEIIDGWHRIEYFSRRGDTKVEALVGKPIGDINRSRSRNPSQIFGRDIAPLAIKAYRSLSVRAKGIIDGWNVNWHMGQDRLRGSAEFDELRAAYEPVRQKLREIYGDTVPAFRGERNDSDGRKASGGERFLFSWTPMRDVAVSYAINRIGGLPKEITQAQVDEQIENYRKTGLARMAGYKYVRRDPGGYEPDGPDYYEIYRGKEMITDGDDIARELQGIKDERDEWIQTLRDSAKVYTADVPVDSLAFIPVGANLRAPEFVAEYNPRKDDAQEVKFSRSRDVAETPEFKRWFGGSKAAVAVNAETGQPIRSSKEPKKMVPQMMYHTTRNNFSEFEIGRITKNSGTFGDWETERAAVFVTPDLDASQEYGKLGGKFAEGANVMPLYIKAENPLDMTSGMLPMSVAMQFDGIGFNSRWLWNFDWSKFDDQDGKDFVEAAKQLGYDSVIFNDENPDTGESFEAWALFEPTQIKSATGNNGDFDPANPDIRRSTKRNPMGFYSALAAEIEKSQTKQAPAGAWKTQLKGLVNKGSVKQDEITWSGLEDWLDLQEGKVTKEAVSDYLKQGGVQVEEVILDSDASKRAKKARDDAEYELDLARAELYQVVPSGLPQVTLANIPGWSEDAYAGDTDAQKKIDALNLDEGATNAVRKYGEAAAAYNQAYGDNTKMGAPKYGQYTLPGGENYREVLLTLPTQRDRINAQLAKANNAYMNAVEEYGQGSDEAKAAKRERDRLSKAMDAEPNYRSNHWDQPNVLAHIRVNDRTDADGKRVLFVEEIQSDLQQSYRKAQAAITKAVERDFAGIVERMKKAGVLEVVCD